MLYLKAMLKHLCLLQCHYCNDEEGRMSHSFCQRCFVSFTRRNTCFQQNLWSLDHPSSCNSFWMSMVTLVVHSQDFNTFCFFPCVLWWPWLLTPLASVKILVSLELQLQLFQIKRGDCLHWTGSESLLHVFWSVVYKPFLCCRDRYFSIQYSFSISCESALDHAREEWPRLGCYQLYRTLCEEKKKISVVNVVYVTMDFYRSWESLADLPAILESSRSCDRAHKWLINQDLMEVRPDFVKKVVTLSTVGHTWKGLASLVSSERNLLCTQKKHLQNRIEEII